MNVYVSDLCDGEQRCWFVDAHLNLLNGLVYQYAREQKAGPEEEDESDEYE